MTLSDRVDLSSTPAERTGGTRRLRVSSWLGLGRVRLEGVSGGWEVGFQTNCPERGRVIK